ncbi:BQ5605_C006g03767 [Microbotryum silenes-dioicae]|uniref:BQ5605_C006g03767 protein n=1 Tax=Microbotryum silenes-dioicae TaxID=796604 RepID=A0A2X0P171_9BASI|nr:BQ5605_C006g03767 [Microbotryum silenes-dioicae]
MLQSRTEVKRNGTCVPSISNRPNPSQPLNSSNYRRWLQSNLRKFIFSVDGFSHKLRQV